MAEPNGEKKLGHAICANWPRIVAAALALLASVWGAGKVAGAYVNQNESEHAVFRTASQKIDAVYDRLGRVEGKIDLLVQSKK